MTNTNPIDEAFIFLKAGSDPTTDRAVLEHTGARTLVVFVPDARAAANVASQLADDGVRLMELYRGFDVAGAAHVVDAVNGRVAVGVAAYGFGKAPEAAIAARKWAQMYSDAYANPATDRMVYEHDDGATTTVVGVPDDAAPGVARELVRNGIEVIDICGGTSLTATARVAQAVGDAALVGHVTFPVESVEAVAAYKAAFRERTQEQR